MDNAEKEPESKNEEVTDAQIEPGVEIQGNHEEMEFEDECWEEHAFWTDNYVVAEIVRKVESSYRSGKTLGSGSFLALVGSGASACVCGADWRKEEGARNCCAPSSRATRTFDSGTADHHLAWDMQS